MAIVAALALPVNSMRHTLATLKPPRKPVPKLDSLSLAFPLEDASFHTSDGLTIRGWYGRSRDGATIVIGHGWNDTRASMLPEAEALASAGFGVLLFDWRGEGISDGEGTTWGEKEQLDLTAAISWLRERAPGDRVGALGFSMGGMTLVEVAARDVRIRAVALEGTFPSLEDVAYQNASGRGALTGIPAVWALRWFGPHLDAVRPVDRLCSLSPRPVLLIYGSGEHAARFDLPSVMFHAACSPKKLWIVAGAGHGEYARVDPSGLRRELVDFFSRALLDAR
jgi:pimeloyl-ACP methyl ester carboxylesterase